ncbi:MAG: NUDIX hydrolase [Paracoccaceae bacterium]
MDFTGAKVLLVLDGAVLTYLRDDTPDLPWAGMWDLPGGGREGGESAEECVLREVFEEFGLRFGLERLLWRRVVPSMKDAARNSVFFAGRIAAAEVAAIRFGCEGQYWRMMPVAEFIGHAQAIPELQRRARVALAELGWV